MKKKYTMKNKVVNILLSICLVLTSSLAFADTALIDEQFYDRELSFRWTVEGKVRERTGGEIYLEKTESIETAVDTRGYTALKLLLDVRTENLTGSEFAVAEWSSDAGTTWNTIATLKDIEPDYTEFDYTLDSSALGHAALLFRIRNVSDSDTERLYLSSVILNAEGEGTGIVPLFEDDFSGNTFGSVWDNPLALVPGGGFLKLKANSHISFSLSTTDYEDITLFYVRNTKGLPSGVFGTLEWSLDGTSWTVLEQTQDKALSEASFVLPASASDQASISFRFSINGSTGKHKYYTDYLRVTGARIVVAPTPTPTPEPTATPTPTPSPTPSPTPTPMPTATPTPTLPPGPDPSFTDTSYIYDSDGQRVTKTVSGDPSSAIHYVYDTEGRLIAEVDANGNTIREQVYVNGERVAFVSEPGTPNEATHFVHNDHLGTPKVVTAADKSVAWQAEYKPFGEVYGLDGTVENDFRFPGQYYDSETGYYYNYFRDYDPSIGRYLESDPIGLNGGLSIHVYVDGNPLTYNDPLGLGACYIHFDGYPITLPGTDLSLPLGHAGVLSWDNSTGRTRYYEYGRYVNEFGQVIRRTIPDLILDENGNPTPESWKRLVDYLSKLNKDREISSECDENADDSKVNKFAERLKTNLKRKPYSWNPFNPNHCKTFARDAFNAGRDN